MDDKFSIHNSFAVLDEKILAVGQITDVRNFINSNYANLEKIEINLSGKTVVPGFIDSHMHPILSIYFKTQLPLTKIKSIKELKEAFKSVIASKMPDEWILGVDFLEERFSDPRERRSLTKKDLDTITTTHPIVLYRHDGHGCITNTRGLEILGITQDTLSEFEIEHGNIEIDDLGEPSGVFTESATSILFDKIPIPNLESFTQAGLDFSTEMASLGITTLGAIVQTTEEGPAGKIGSTELPIMQMLIREKALNQDYVFYMITDKPKKLVRYKKNIEKLDGGKEQFVVGGIKRFLDGAIGARTAYLSEPYSDGPPNNYGLLTHDRDDLLTQFKQTHELGFQIICHAIGDKAIHVLVDVYKEMIEDVKKDDFNTILRIEHASILTEQLLREISQNNIIISSQPTFIDSEYFWLPSRLGDKRCKLTYPFRSIMDSGILLAGASDAPIENPDVLNAISTSMHRYGFTPDESLTIQQALRIFTINAAKALGQGKVKGSIEIGKYADFVILDENILEVNEDEIKKINILETYRRGKRIYKK